jgi:hypothetical protein
MLKYISDIFLKISWSGITFASSANRTGMELLIKTFGEFIASQV